MRCAAIREGSFDIRRFSGVGPHGPAFAPVAHMKRIIRTRYPHLYEADGTRRGEPCSGYLDIVCEEAGVHVRCDECGEGYRFEFVMRRGDMLANGKSGKQT